jgi:circadian clock protein KaiC
MNGKVVIRRLATGVPGLDAVLGGGMPEFSFNLIVGPPGCGKTTLAHQLMFALAGPGRSALYLTGLGETAVKMLRYQQQFDFFDSAALGRHVHFVSLADDVGGGSLVKVLDRIVHEVQTRAPAFVFVDSFRSVAMRGSAGQGSSRQVLQQFTQQLGTLMSTWQATTFLVGEYSSDADANPVFTVADGIVWLRQSVQRNSMVRKLQVLKMRGQATLPGLHSFRIGPAGLEVFAAAPAAPGHATPQPDGQAARLGTGVAALDDMLGGGVPRGYSVLVAGPSGSGKSILASTFLAEGARRGERGVVAAFEQHPNRARNPVLAALIDDGRVGLVDSRVPDLSIDEIVLRLVHEIRRLGATRVVIDSLSGFELTLAPTFRTDFRESLLRLVTALAAEGVTVLMTSELEDRYTDLRFSPYGTAFLTDAIIVQRYIEVGSRLRRVMAVVKLRACAHSDQLREYCIDAGGIQVGAPLPEQEGLLGGRPTLIRPIETLPNPSGPVTVRREATP